MPNKKDYSKLSIEELLLEEKKIKKNEMLTAGLIGLLIGVLIFGVVKNGIGFFHIFLPLLLISWIYKNSLKSKQILKQIQAEIRGKNVN